MKNNIDSSDNTEAKALQNEVIPVFVFDELGPPLSAIKKGEFQKSVFAYLSNSTLQVWVSGEWKTVENGADILSLRVKPDDYSARILVVETTLYCFSTFSVRLRNFSTFPGGMRACKLAFSASLR